VLPDTGSYVDTAKVPSDWRAPEIVGDVVAIQFESQMDDSEMYESQKHLKQKSTQVY